MSLDVHLYGPATEEPCTCSTCDNQHARIVSPCLFSANITHNLNDMAKATGLYVPLWRPEMLDVDRAARIKEQEAVNNYHGANGVYEIEREAAIAARDLIEPIATGLATLKSDPGRFKEFDPRNGWGDYNGLVEWTEKYLAACREYPDAEVTVSR
jgi:hypothetical protein